jgi:hypothetical protein
MRSEEKNRRQLSQAEAFYRLQFFDTVMQRNSTFPRIIHECLDGGVAELRRPAQRDLIFAKSFQGDSLRRFPGHVISTVPGLRPRLYRQAVGGLSMPYMYNRTVPWLLRRSGLVKLMI